MKKRDDPRDPAQEAREKLIGLGRNAVGKSYYPELKKRLEELERFRSLLGQVSDGIFVVESDSTRIVDISGSAPAMTGLERDELLGKPFRDLLSRDSARAFSAVLHKEDNRFCIEAILEHPDTAGERTLPVEMNIRTARNSDNGLAIIVARDISERRQAEAEAARARQYLSGIIDSMPSLLVGVDSRGLVTQWNAEAERRTGIQAAKAVGRPAAKFLAGLDFDMGMIDKALATRQRVTVSKRMRLVDGKEKYEDITVFPLAYAELGGVVIRMDDITEGVVFERIMVHTEKMMSLGGLAAGMAHEINNPLASIMGNAQTLQNRLLTSLPKNKATAGECGVEFETIRRYAQARGLGDMIGAIHESGARAAGIVRNMLNFSRKSDQVTKATNIADLLDVTLKLVDNDFDLKEKYDFRSIDIVREYPEESQYVVCDSTEIQQVLFNLLRNGAEAMMEKEYEEASPRFILRIQPEDGMVAIEVEDNGPGMDETVRSRVFEPFYTTKGPNKGTGLGLSVSYFIVTEQHGGLLEVDSKPGKWTRFTIKLPIQGKPTPQAGHPTQE